MSKSAEKEPVTSVELEPNEPEKSAAEKKERTNMILVVLLILAAGVGIEAYFFILKTRWEKKMPSALDEFDPDDKK